MVSACGRYSVLVSAKCYVPVINSVSIPVYMG